MAAPEKFSLLRTILRTIGLSDEAVEDIIDRILAFLSPKQEAAQAAFPYALRDDFLSPAEQSFCMVLQGIVTAQLMICPKVALADLFFANTGDARQNRICLNRIDRKHVDFLLCEPKTLRPKVAIELDDRSHERHDRQERDVFVDGVFAAANLPLVRVQAKRGYAAAELDSLLRPYLRASPQSAPSPSVGQNLPAQSDAHPGPAASNRTPLEAQEQAPLCPKCGTEMLLRTARTGANQGDKFWGCRNFPRCRAIVPFGKRTG
jgi:hypothetical protein